MLVSVINQAQCRLDWYLENTKFIVNEQVRGQRYKKFRIIVFNFAQLYNKVCTFLLNKKQTGMILFEIIRVYPSLSSCSNCDRVLADA